ncbi:diamine acetyltransferase 2 [Elysia marginata]|uniref:Diamine acetyltransferase 2 n=1 Tax=Elysia marginata TaxID=1093978 RepID=A0AAV4GA73_9GAST|nr:diamine acetyltransferase 2 [Elysia marginata]
MDKLETPSATDEVVIRSAELKDCEEIVRLIMELAEFENMADRVTMTAQILRNDCFDEKPKCSCVVASKEDDQSCLVGYSLFYPVYSTWVGASLYLEDLYVTPSYRSRGIGKQLCQKVTQIGLEMGCNRIDLTVLDWNKTAKDMYERYGFVDLTSKEDFHTMRLERGGMENFVKKSKCKNGI